MLPLSVAVLIGAGLVAQTGGTPDIQVLNGSTPVPVNGTVSFGTARAGVANSKTFTVTNTGTANLLVSEAIATPRGFTLMASFPGVPNALLPNNTPAYTIAPNATATFTVALNSATAGNFSGSLSLATNVANKNPYVFKVTGKVLPPPSVRYVDDVDAGFTSTSNFTQGLTTAGDSGRGPFQSSLTWADAGTGTQTATWRFTGLEPGQYKVSATWPGYSKLGGAAVATNTPFTISDGTTPVGNVPVNQQVDSSGNNDGGSVWQDLGVFFITSSTLTVSLSDNANGIVLADGVRMERVGYPGAIVDDAGPGFSTPSGMWFSLAISTDFQGGRRTSWPTTTPGTPTAVAQWTFTVTPGTYRVLAGYDGDTWSATNAPYSIFDNATNLTTTPIRVNQSVAPTNLVDTRPGWKDLGFFQVSSTSLIVQLSNDANGWVNADAVRIERVNVPTVWSTADTVRFLEQATWGPTPALITQVQGVGFPTWLSQQFDPSIESSYPTLPLYNTNSNVANNNTTSCYGDPTVAGNPARSACTRDHYSQYPNQNRFFVNALYGQDQLRQRMAWTLHKIWVISGVQVTQSAWVAPYLQILSGNAFGNYRDLMFKITLNPGMGNYLSMAGSRKAGTNSAPNENYPREVMQLFTIGLNELNPDGSLKLDGNGNPIPTYDQTLIDNMSKVFTGWNFAPRLAAGIPNYIDPMRLNGAATENPLYHDFSAKHLLRGYVQPAITGTTNTTGATGVANAYLQLNQGLDNIYNHPNLPPFVCKQLIQQLVTSNPSPAYVARVVDTFNRNRTSGSQLAATVSAILLDPEARGDVKSAANYGHLKEPVLYINNLMRMFDAKSADRTQPSDGYLDPGTFFAAGQGQDVFKPASVFSYFSPFKVAVGGNPPVVGPEFQIQTTTSALGRANLSNQCFTPNSGRAIDVVRAAGKTPSGTDPFGNPIVPTGPLGTAVDVSFLLPLAGNPSALADQLNVLMLHGTMTADMKASLVTAVNAVAATNTKKRVHTAVYLVASSSQYQVQR
jgi:uncharacterized protein (DUF1800 family)